MSSIMYQNVNSVFTTQSTIAIVFNLLCCMGLNKEKTIATYKITDVMLPFHKNSLMVNRNIENNKIYFEIALSARVFIINKKEEVEISTLANIIVVAGAAIIEDSIAIFKMIATMLKTAETQKSIFFVF